MAKIFIGIAAAAVVLFLFATTFFVRIHPWHFGVKQNMLGGGVVMEDHETGFALRVPGVHQWHLIDRRTHFVTFAESDVHTSFGMARPALEIRTKDNNLATYDLSVTYKVIQGRAHRIVADRRKDVYRERVLATVEAVMREELAQLASEEIFSTEARLEVARTALARLDKDLDEFHCVPDQVLIRAVRFPDGYEARLQEKQLTYQKRELAESQRAVEDQRAITETKAAEISAAEKELRGDWDKRLQTASSENQVAIASVNAEANIYEQRTRAQADARYETSIANGNLAIEKAEALRNELRNQALDTTGGRIFLAQQAAENLEFESVTLNSNDPRVPSVINVSEMVRLLVGEDEPGGSDR
ncbi:MAG: SPFH domain-containing protein [Planctomycetota bacterium]